MKIVMNMSSYETDTGDPQPEYDEEVLSSGWNPAVELLHLLVAEVCPDEQQLKSAVAFLQAFAPEIPPEETAQEVLGLDEQRVLLH